MDRWIYLPVALALVTISIVFTVLWIHMLIHAAKTERWGWFVVMLVFGLAGLLYFFTEYESPARLRARQRHEEQRVRQRRDRRPERPAGGVLEQEVAELREEVRRLREESGQ